MQGMTVGQLKELLEQYDDNMPVRMMTQQHYPLQTELFGVVQQSEYAADEMEVSKESLAKGYDEFDTRCTFEDDCLYLLEGGQCDAPYGDKRAWDNAKKW